MFFVILWDFCVWRRNETDYSEWCKENFAFGIGTIQEFPLQTTPIFCVNCSQIFLFYLDGYTFEILHIEVVSSSFSVPIPRETFTGKKCRKNRNSPIGFLIKQTVWRILCYLTQFKRKSTVEIWYTVFWIWIFIGEVTPKLASATTALKKWNAPLGIGLAVLKKPWDK